VVPDGSDLIKTKGYFRSNLDRPSKIQWSKLLLPYLVSENRGGVGVAAWPRVRELGFALWCTNL
jgi:hypothetical protein